MDHGFHSMLDHQRISTVATPPTSAHWCFINPAPIRCSHCKSASQRCFCKKGKKKHIEIINHLTYLKIIKDPIFASFHPFRNCCLRIKASRSSEAVASGSAQRFPAFFSWVGCLCINVCQVYSYQTGLKASFRISPAGSHRLKRPERIDR